VVAQTTGLQNHQQQSNTTTLSTLSDSSFCVLFFCIDENQLSVPLVVAQTDGSQTIDTSSHSFQTNIDNSLDL